MVHAASAAFVSELQNAAEAACTGAPKQSRHFLDTTLASRWNEEKRLKEKALASYCPTLDFGRYTVTGPKNNSNPRGLYKIQGLLRALGVRLFLTAMILSDRESGPPPSAHPPPTAASIPGRGAASRYQ